MEKEFFVVISKDSPFGQFLLELRNKIGGASTTMDVGGVSHPVMVCKGLDWSKSLLFVSMIQLRDPGEADPLPREIAVPSSVILLVAEAGQTASQKPAEPQASPSHLH